MNLINILAKDDMSSNSPYHLPKHQHTLYDFKILVDFCITKSSENSDCYYIKLTNDIRNELK